MSTSQTSSRRIPNIVDEPDISKRAAAYEEKVSGALNMVMQMTIGNEKTVADAAAIIEHGPGLAKQLGVLADHDPKVRASIDFITSGTSNPYAAVVVAAIPLIAQILRNHEQETPTDLEIKLPIIKRIFRVKWRIRLKSKALRSLTKTKDEQLESQLGRDDIRMALAAQEIDVAWNGGKSRANGKIAAKP